MRRGHRIADEEIGRVKTVWMTPEGQAIISSLIAHAIPKSKSSKLIFKDFVNIEESVKQHLQETILKQVNDINSSLNLSSKSFTLSAINIGAASSSGIGISISGHSIDVSVFLALLSSALNLPICQDTVFTGHIGSNEGDILPVEHLAKKCEAALTDPHIHHFVYPNLDPDISFKKLKPTDYNSALTAIRSCRGKIKLYEVSNTRELINKVIEPRAILFASLRSSFFDFKQLDYRNDRLKSTIAYLTENNQKWFWDVLEANLLEKDTNKSHEIMNLYLKYYEQGQKYPSKFGEKLYKLIISLPSHIRRTPGMFPLIPKTQYINIVQFAQESDYDDTSLLHNALYGEIRSSEIQTVMRSKRQQSKNTKHLLDHILHQLEPSYIESSVTYPYDEACAKYSFDTVTVINNEEFIDAITAFYTHLYRHTNKIQGSIDKNRLSAEALHVLKKTFKGEKGYKEAFANARDGRHGGLRYIINKMTEYLKDEAREKHILKTFKENIDPYDYKIRVNLIKEIMNRSKYQLPEEITSQPPERFAENPEEIIQAFAQSKIVLENILRGL